VDARTKEGGDWQGNLARAGENVNAYRGLVRKQREKIN
jgi:hypothetical protein